MITQTPSSTCSIHLFVKSRIDVAFFPAKQRFLPSTVLLLVVAELSCGAYVEPVEHKTILAISDELYSLGSVPVLSN
jgi:hypothetical protein